MYRKRNNVDPVRVPITHYNNSEVYSYIKLVEAISTKITNQEKLKKKKKKKKRRRRRKTKRRGSTYVYIFILPKKLVM